MELFRNTDINEHAIELTEDKQPLCRPIYTISPVKLETLKIYITIYLKTRFIRSFKSLTKLLILMDKKSDNCFYLYFNYWGPNNITIKT